MVFFKFPFDENIYTTDETSSETAVSFYPFDGFSNVSFSGNIIKISKEEFINQNFESENLDNFISDFKEETQTDYEQKIGDVISFVKENRLPKLVISRRKKVPFEKRHVNFAQTFLNLTNSYSNAFVYFFIKDGKCWIGAFSEVLGNFNRKTSSFETMALAGTLPANENWTSKEIEEQKPVSDYIFNILKNHSQIVNISETQNHISGNIKHLRTDFKAEINPQDLDKIISDLHPTPAVCGFPKEICIPAIKEFEPNPRKLYAGYIKVELAESTHYYVNLRCAEIFRDAALIYVGGGITADSNPEKEWQETELKAEAILKNLRFL